MLGEILGAAGGLVSGIMGAQANKAAMQKQLDYQASWNKHKIATTVRDAKAAGVHPLYALGANVGSFSPVPVGDLNPMSGLADAGQAIGRAIDAGAPESGKATTILGTEAAKAQIRGLQLDNEIKRVRLASDIATLGAGATRPGVPDPMMPPRLIDGQGDATMVDPKSAFKVQKQISAASPFDPTGATEAGVTPEVQFVKTKTGWAPTVPQSLQEAYENDWLGQAQWQLRNRVYPFMPNIGSKGNQFYNPPFKAPAGKHWMFNGVIGEYQLRENE